MIERFAVTSGARDRRVFEWARESSDDALAGRTVWSVSALPDGRAAARSLRHCLASQASTAASPQDPGWLEIDGDARLTALAQRLERMLAGAASPRPLGPSDEHLYAQGLPQGDSAVAAVVAPGDVVVLHDALTAALAESVRARGAHAVWHVRPVGARRRPGVSEASSFLRRHTPALDARVMAWRQPGPRGAPTERIAALMPCAGLMAACEIASGQPAPEPRRVGWRSVLAEVIQGDRDEVVGGTLHPRPAVAAR
jgi:hypothetical protein